MVKPQGRRGEVAAELHTSFPERFAERRQLFLLEPAGGRRRVELEDFWAHKGRVVLKLAGVDSISQAEALVGCELQIAGSERAPLEAGAYVTDLIGCVLWAREGGGEPAEIGPITGVRFGAGEAPLLVVHAGGCEHLLPLAETYLAGAGMDVAARRVEMAFPEGMLGLATPLPGEKVAKTARRPRAGRRKR